MWPCRGAIELAGHGGDGRAIVRMVLSGKARAICAAPDLLCNGHSWTAAIPSQLPDPLPGGDRER